MSGVSTVRILSASFVSVTRSTRPVVTVFPFCTLPPVGRATADTPPAHRCRRTAPSSPWPSPPLLLAWRSGLKLSQGKFAAQRSCPARVRFAAAPFPHIAGVGVPDGPRFFFRREYSALPSAGHFCPQRPADFFLACLRRGMFRAPERGSLLAAYPAKAKIYADRRTTNRLYVSPRCRSRVPRGDALVYRLCGGVLACRFTKCAS